MNQQILAYIKQEAKAGRSLKEIKKSLMQMMRFNNWSEPQIEGALNQFQAQSAVNQSETRESSEVSDSNPPGYIKKSKSHLGNILVIAFLLVLFLGGAGAYAYFYIFPSPERVIQEMFKQQKKADFFGYESQVDFKISSGKEGAADQRFLVKINGKYDMRNEKNIKSLSVVDASFSGGFLGNLSIGLEVRTLGDVSYIRATNLPKLGFIDLSSIQNKWIKINAKDAAKQLGMSGELEKREEEKNKIQDVLLERMDKITKLFKQSGIIQSIDKLPDAVINGHKTYHYKIVVNKDALRGFLSETLKIVYPERKISKEELVSFNSFFENLRINDIELWIGKEDKLLYKVSANFDGRSSKNASNANLSLEIKFKDYNKEVDIKAPTDAKSIQDILKGSSFLGKVEGLNPAQEKALTAKRDAEIKQIRFALKVYRDQYGHYPSSLSQLFPKFLPKVPGNSESGIKYEYKPQQDGKGYSLCAQSPEGQKCSFSF